MNERLATLFAAALVVAEPATAAEEVRLFTTVEQRERLDQLRAEATAEQLAREAPEAPETREADASPEPEPPPAVHLRGFVRRSDGPSAVWVNEGSTIEGIDDGIRIDAGRIRGDSVVVRLPDGRRLRLKPGQRWDPERGEVVDVADP